MPKNFLENPKKLQKVKTNLEKDNTPRNIKSYICTIKKKTINYREKIIKKVSKVYKPENNILICQNILLNYYKIKNE